jgi:hypothetical protein
MANTDVPQKMPRQPSENRNQRRLIDIAPNYAFAASHVVHFVAEIAIAVRY